MPIRLGHVADRLCGARSACLVARTKQLGKSVISSLSTPHIANFPGSRGSIGFSYKLNVVRISRARAFRAAAVCAC